MNFLEHIKDHFFTLDINILPVTPVTVVTNSATHENDLESSGNEIENSVTARLQTQERLLENGDFDGLMNSSECPVNYAQLLDQATHEGKTDLDADNLDAALFLYAFNLVKSFRHDIPGQLEPFMAMGKCHVPYWRKRLHPDAWSILSIEIKHKLRLLGWSKDSK